MAAVPEGVQILFDNEVEEGNGSEGSTTSSESGPRDFHREQYPAYQPPHLRGHNTQQDKFVNFKNRDPRKGVDPDTVEGVDNIKYQRLKLPVPFALPRDKLNKLKADFNGGVYFHCKDNGAHDHPYSHIVTMIGTSFMQRMIQPGSRILDVYGNPRACDTFNLSQERANNPKVMTALVCRMGPEDFIREVNKWGPFMSEEGDERYHRGTLREITQSGELAQYNVLHLTHTLYYIQFDELAEALHSPVANGGKRVAYALIHRHPSAKGELNDGEQVYEKRVKFGQPLVRQVNVATNSAYIHPDLTPVLFSEDKTWMPKDGNNGLAWSLNKVNDETWIVQLVPYQHVEARADVIDYAEMWDMEDDDYMSSDIATPTSSNSGIVVTDTGRLIPTSDGKFVEVTISNTQLFGHLVSKCVGKKRDRKLLDELIRIANHHVNPSALFGDKQGLRCPPDKIFDHAVAAFMEGVDHETQVMQSISVLRPVLSDHAVQLNLGPKYKDYSIRDLFSAVQSALGIARGINTVVRSKDPVGQGLAAIQDAME